MGKPPVIQKRDQKKTLSAQKGKKEVIKNLLVNPYDEYFPEMNQSEAAGLLEFLEQLPSLKCTTKIPWADIKAIPKESRKSFRAEQSPEFQPPESEIKSNLIFGVNKVTRLLESEKCPASVLITADVNPRYMVKHVIDLCVLKKVNVLVVPKLKETLASSTGIPTIVLGLNDVRKFDAFNEKVKTLCANYPVPERHAHFAEDEACCVEPEQSVVEDEEIAVTKNFHLIRTDPNVRVFVPETSKAKSQTNPTDFLSFDDRKPTLKTNYIGLKVKSVRKNANRPKKFKPLV